MPNTPDFIAHVLELMLPAAPASARAMFGGHGIYAGGPIVAIVIDDILYFKSDEANRAEIARTGEAVKWRSQGPGVNDTSSSTVFCTRTVARPSMSPPFSRYCAFLISRTLPRTAGAYQTW
jgi:hypothetical protein